MRIFTLRERNFHEMFNIINYYFLFLYSALVIHKYGSKEIHYPTKNNFEEATLLRKNSFEKLITFSKNISFTIFHLLNEDKK